MPPEIAQQPDDPNAAPAVDAGATPLLIPPTPPVAAPETPEASDVLPSSPAPDASDEPAPVTLEVFPEAQDESQTTQDEPEPEPTEAPPMVPLARLQGTQRALSQAERDRDSHKAMADALRQQLDAANQLAAQHYAERIRATHSDIVPSLISGSTIEQVDASLQNSRAAFAAARQAYARTLPTPNAVPSASAGNPPAAQPNAQPTTPLEMIRAGLRQPPTDINR